jgi:hypothetical protein
MKSQTTHEISQSRPSTSHSSQPLRSVPSPSLDPIRRVWKQDVVQIGSSFPLSQIKFNRILQRMKQSFSQVHLMVVNYVCLLHCD